MWDGIAWYEGIASWGIASGITWETREFRESTPGKLGFFGFIWYIIKILILPCRRQGTVQFGYNRKSKMLTVLDIWTVYHLGNDWEEMRNAEMEKVKPDFSNLF